MENKFVEFDDFQKLDIRAGTIIRIESFPEALNSSYKIYVDFGDLGMRKTSAQITANYKIDELLGEQIIGVLNLKEKIIAGFKSEFLLLGVNDSEGEVVILTPERFVKEGAKVY